MSAKARASESADPTPEIPAVESQPTTTEETLQEMNTVFTNPPPQTSASVAQSTSAQAPAGLPGARQGRLASVPPRTPIQKEIRVIRVRTVDGVSVIINAQDYDPELHTPLTDDDKKWGEMAVKARIAAADQREQEAYIKRLVRGRGL